MTVELRIDADFRKAQKLFGPKAQGRVKRAASRALNEVARKTKTEATNQIAAEIPIKKKAIRRAISIKRARIGDLEALVMAAGHPRIPMIFTTPKPRQVKKGVSYKLDGKRRIVKGAFIAQMPGGHKGVFKRYGKRGKRNRKREKQYHDLSIQEQTVPGIPHTFSNRKIEKTLLKIARVQWPKSFDRLIRLELSKL